MASTASTTELGRFLRARRDALTPERAGIVGYGVRRVPGLRREELAQLAGVSVAYYTRLEQGQSSGASDSIIGALATALQLREDERAYLFELARPTIATRRRAQAVERASLGVQQFVSAIGEIPVVALGRCNDVLAWNGMAHALFAGHVPFALDVPADARPNFTRMLFLDQHTRDLYRDWAGEARRAVASLRITAAQFPDDLRLAGLVGELSVKSGEFARLWNSHSVERCTAGTKQLHHPELGALDVQYTALHVPDAAGQRLMSYAAAPGSASADALALLRQQLG